jgi:hypothetical protein
MNISKLPHQVISKLFAFEIIDKSFTHTAHFVRLSDMYSGSVRREARKICINKHLHKNFKIKLYDDYDNEFLIKTVNALIDDVGQVFF